MIFITNARCELCGAPLRVQEDKWSQYATTGDLFVDLADPEIPRISVLCKDRRVCEENQHNIRKWLNGA